MKAVRKGLENIRTLRSMVNNSMPMTSRGALMERARLNQEEERLWNEMDRLRRRMGVIKNRLEEIEKIEAWLERLALNVTLRKNRDKAVKGYSEWSR